MRVKGKIGHNVSFDSLPDDYKEVHVERKNMMSVADHEGEEKENGHAADECDKIKDEESNIQLKSQREFSNLSDDAAYSAAKFAMKLQDDKKMEK